VGADAVHHVEDAFATAAEFALDAQRRKLVGHHTHAPAEGIRRAAVTPVGEHFGGRLDFVATAEGAFSALAALGRVREIRGPPGALGGDDDPATHDRVFA